ncbi:biotin/lipoyl-binding protein, partial [Symbiobacterium thermophilum]
MKRKVWIAAALLAAVAVLVVANLRNQPASGTAAQGPKGAPEVRVQAVKRGSLRQEVIAPGVLEATGVHEVRAPFATKSVTLRVGIGERVTAGQVLAVLDDADLALQVSAQEAQVARMES